MTSTVVKLSATEGDIPGAVFIIKPEFIKAPDPRKKQNIDSMLRLLGDLLLAGYGHSSRSGPSLKMRGLEPHTSHNIYFSPCMPRPEPKLPSKMALKLPT